MDGGHGLGFGVSRGGICSIGVGGDATAVAGELPACSAGESVVLVDVAAGRGVDGVDSTGAVGFR
jgi:hypothetical protein